MAATLQITDGSTTVNLLNTSGLYLKKNGWTPAVVPELDDGRYADVVDVITCTWVQTDDDNRSSTLQNLQRLARKARLWWRKRRPWGQAVWIAANTHSETDTRYSLIKNVEIRELDPRHWGAQGPVELTILVTHGLWWDVAPNGTPATAVNAETIYNKEDADGENEVDVPAANLTGDAPALSQIIIVPQTGSMNLQTLWMGMKTNMASSAMSSWFIPSNLVDTTDNISETQAPGDYALKIGDGLSAANETKYWEVAAADVFDYQGTYEVYLSANTDVANGAVAQLKYGVFTTGGTVYNTELAEVDIQNTTTSQEYRNHYLGRLEIVAHEHATSTNQKFRIAIEVTTSANGIFYSQGLFIVPVDESSQHLNYTDIGDASFGVATNDKLIVDSWRKTVYHTDSSDGLLQEFVFSPFGWIRLEPGVLNRLYFFWEDGASGLVANQTAQVTVKVINQFTALRGNT